MAGKTEWEDALIKHGIMAAPEVKPTDDELALGYIEQRQAENVAAAEAKSLATLAREEDDMKEDDLKRLRAKRLQEMKEKAARDKYGSVLHIGQTEWVKEVTQAPAEDYVVAHLYVHGKPECQTLNNCMDALAPRFRQVKFVRIRSIDAIPDYPDRFCPTVIVYKASNPIKQIQGLDAFGGLRQCTPESVEWALSRLGALTTELEENPLDRPPQYNIHRSTGKSEFVTTSGSSGHHSVGGTAPAAAKKTTFTRPVQKDLSDDELSD